MSESQDGNGAVGEAMVDVRNVRRTFHRGRTPVPVLKDLSLRMEKGEFLALMGPSGSGKSTLLNLIAGLDRPTGGEVIVGGSEIHRLSERKLAGWRSRNVGFVFQFSNLLGALSAERNVAVPLLLTSFSARERRRRVDIALEIVGLSERGKHRPRELSGGEQQRVGIARALVNDPMLLVCDEPTGDLDRTTSAEILDLLVALNRDHGKTILMVTHDPVAAERASRTLHLEDGRLAEGGDDGTVAVPVHEPAGAAV
ncbi:MAG: ABC transporter ATP-binding protein [Acidobacteriota bacterium]|nr:ABC transporter ATP-binding protein [Acidobacteriota bacterium]